MSDIVTHAEDCAGPRMEIRLRASGDIRHRCLSCKMYEHVSPQEATYEAEGVAVHARGLGFASNYRCRTHQDTPVTWKGTGCQHCNTVRAPKPEPKPEPLLYGPIRAFFPSDVGETA